MILIWDGPTEGVIFKENSYICSKQPKMKESQKIGFLKNTEYRNPGFYICLTLYMALKIETKKVQKKRGADGLFRLAAKWAEMAADHENGRNPKIFFSPLQGHYVAS